MGWPTLALTKTLASGHSRIGGIAIHPQTQMFFLLLCSPNGHCRQVSMPCDLPISTLLPRLVIITPLGITSPSRLQSALCLWVSFPTRTLGRGGKMAFSESNSGLQNTEFTFPHGMTWYIYYWYYKLKKCTCVLSLMSKVSYSHHQTFRMCP